MRNWIDLFENYRITLADREAAWAILQDMRPNYSIDSYFSHLADDEVDDALHDLLSEAEWAVISCVREGRLPVYREIIAPADWDIASETRQHAFWSYSADAAHSHWGEGSGVRWLIRGSVAATDVNWPDTIAHNANPGLTDECEVRLLPGVQVSDLAAEQRPDGWKHDIY